MAVDLTTHYLGLQLANPIVAGASPLTRELDNVRRFEDAGVGAVVLPSIFEEQIEREQQAFEDLLSTGANANPEALSYFPAQMANTIAPERHAEFVRRASEAIDIPVIPSLNGVTTRGWIDYARQMEEAGARALELNIYFLPVDLSLSGREVEERYLDVVKAVKAAVAIPVAVKIGPYFSAMGQMAQSLVEAGADGLVLFNRFYHPDIDLAQMKLLPNLELSTPNEIRLPLLWIGVLHGAVSASLAGSTGVDGVDEIVKYLLVGADVVMATSAFLRHGVGHAKVLRRDLERWLELRGLENLDRIRGSMSQRNVADPAVFARANYIRVLQDYRVPR